MRKLEIKENDKILIIAPHPDDECIGPGGVLLKYSRQCDVIVLTDGRQGQGDVSPIEGIKIRRGEFMREMESLDIKSYKLLDIEDGTLLSHTDCLADISLTDYSIVFVTGIQDNHSDHKAAYLSLEVALSGMDGNKPRCFAYEVHSPLPNPTHFLDITDSIEKKTKLIQFHKSQIRDLPYDDLAVRCAEYRAILFRMPEKKIEVYEELDLDGTSSNGITESEVLLQKERVIGWVLKKWVRNLMNGMILSERIKVVAPHGVYVYGYGELGRLLLEELQKAGLCVKAVIDRRAEQFVNETVDVILLENADEKIPVIVTAVFEYENIKEELIKRGFAKIYSLRDLVESMKGGKHDGILL